MNRANIFLIIFSILFGADLLATETTTQEVLSRWIDALGGKEKLSQIHTTYRKSDITYSGLTGTSEVWITSDGKFRLETKLGSVSHDITVFQSHDKAWYRDTNGKVQEIRGVDLEDVVLDAYVLSLSHLITGRMPGTVEYAGKSEDGKLFLLKLIPENGRELLMFLDSSTYLPVRAEQKFHDRKQVTLYLNYKPVEGILFPRELQIDTGRKDLYVAKVTETKLNEELSAKLFEKPEEGPPDYAFTSGNAARDIPMQLTSNHIYLPMQLNDSKETLWFILDTGASVTVIEAGIAKKLGITGEGQLKMGGAGEGTVDTAMVAGITFRLPGAEVRNQQAFTIPLESLFAREGRRIEGILGYDFLSRFVVVVDYAAQKVHLHDYKSYQYSGKGEIIPIVLEGNSPYVNGTIQTSPDANPVPFKSLIDTGSRLAFSLNKPFHEKHEMLKEVKTKYAPMGIGVGGATRDQVGRIAKLQLGSLSFANVITGFSMDEKGAGADQDSDADIGGEILRRFTLIIDYNQNRLILEKNKAFEEPFEYDRTGMLLAAEGQDFKTFRVMEVLEDSPAAEAGVHTKDVLVSANGKSAKEWNYDSLRAFLRTNRKPIQLVFERNGKRIEVRLTPRELI